MYNQTHPKIALVHDYLTQEGGAEMVLKILCKIFPKAPLFTLFYFPQNVDPFFKKVNIQTSFLQKYTRIIKNYQLFLNLMPRAIENLNLMNYDIVISSSSAFAKGIITSPESKHICYCHTPTRYLWSDTHDYLKELKYNFLIKKFIPKVIHRLRQWDYLAAQRVDKFLANSKNIQNRIQKYYHRESEIIYPPVDCQKFQISKKRKYYFLTGGRLVAYKRFDLAIKVFNKLGWPLKIFGTGPQTQSLKQISKPNIEFLGYVPEEKLKIIYSQAKAFIHPQKEDFGITSIEAQASGVPVIAYNAGGSKETILPEQTGILFNEQNYILLKNAVLEFNEKEKNFNPELIREHAMKFDKEVFIKKISTLLQNTTK